MILDQYLSLGQSGVNLTQKKGLALGPQKPPFCPWFAQPDKCLVPGELCLAVAQETSGDQGQVQLGGRPSVSTLYPKYQGISGWLGPMPVITGCHWDKEVLLARVSREFMEVPDTRPRL